MLRSVVFPHDTPGLSLDTLARHALWQLGLDYRHGTGHGVGAALNVHEGPHSISKRCAPDAGDARGHSCAQDRLSTPSVASARWRDVTLLIPMLRLHTHCLKLRQR